MARILASAPTWGIWKEKPWFVSRSDQCFFFIGEFTQKYELKNVISTNTKELSWEKWSKFAKFRKKKKKIKTVKFLQ